MATGIIRVPSPGPSKVSALPRSTCALARLRTVEDKARKLCRALEFLAEVRRHA